MELTFITGGAIRRVYIKKRRVSIISAETNFTPVIIDLDKLDERIEELIKSKTLSKEDIDRISKLHTEEEIADDIIADYKKMGLRLIKKQ